MKKIKLGIFGPSGRMGTSIISELKEFKSQLILTSLCEQKNHPSKGKIINEIEIVDCLESFVKNCEVIIDFTSPDATLKLMKKLNNNSKVCLITGTTGFSKDQYKDFRNLAKKLTVLQSFNMSLGVNLLLQTVQKISEKISDDVDVEISETHHKHKKDAPSGTALLIGNAVKKGRKIKSDSYIFRNLNYNEKRKKGGIGFSSIRGGDVIGEHTTFFFMDGERIEITHKASDRNIFSKGALHAAVWIKNKDPGLYSMIDVLE